MKITPAMIIDKINTEFGSTYRPFSNFVNSGDLWNECINAVNDVKLMNHIIFCNDTLKIPPVKVFLMANDSIVGDLTDTEKQFIGAFWGFVFKFVFHYRSQKDSVPINTKGIKKAAWFYDKEAPVEVIE